MDVGYPRRFSLVLDKDSQVDFIKQFKQDVEYFHMIYKYTTIPDDESVQYGIFQKFYPGSLP